MKPLINSKVFWLICLFADLILVIYGIKTQNIIINLIAIVIAVIISKFGQEIILEEYNKKNKDKEELRDKFYGSQRKGRK